jgi:hypothetical protein
MNRDDGPPPFSSKVEEWFMMTFVMENCLLDLFVVLDLDLEPNSWGGGLSLKSRVIIFFFLTTV